MRQHLMQPRADAGFIFQEILKERRLPSRLTPPRQGLKWNKGRAGTRAAFSTRFVWGSSG